MEHHLGRLCEIRIVGPLRAATSKVERAAMQTDSHVRRVFYGVHEATHWLAEVLDEREPLRRFFG